MAINLAMNGAITGHNNDNTNSHQVKKSDTANKPIKNTIIYFF
jgi:hypothetical protein